MADLYAFEHATDGVRVAGGTDRGLARTLLRRAGIPDDAGAIDRLLATYLVHLESSLRERRYRPIGDVIGAVATLLKHGAVVGVATGNVRIGARLKLESAGLGSTFELDRGGFGCDAEPRAEIVRTAVERCSAFAGAGAKVVVVGDTDHDVRAARAVGARVVGLAVNAERRAELESAGADAIVDTCGEALVCEVLR